MLKPVVIVLAATYMLPAQNYSIQRMTVDGTAVFRLADAAAGVEVMVAPELGNNAYSMQVKGHEVMWSPYKTLGELKQKPALAGNPFLAPWANRIDQDSFFANGKKYTLNDGLGNVRRDGNKKPIHGLVMFASQWKLTSQKIGGEASITCRLDFYREPDWMAQFPFAHTIDMTYRLKDGALEVETVIDNLSSAPMPVSIGFHPYFQLTDSPRDEWQVALPARESVVLSDILVPTGEKTPRDPAPLFALKGQQLDNVYTGLNRGADGKSVFYVQGKAQKLAVEYGPNYPVAVVYAPAGRGFICFEPMSGVTNAFNLGHAGKYPLQSIAPGGKWRESYWIRPSGF